MLPVLYIGVANTEVILAMAGTALVATSSAVTYGVTEVADYFEDKAKQERIIELERRNSELEYRNKFGDKFYIKR